MDQYNREEVDDEARWVGCDYCDVELELSAEELAQGWYLCPECDQLSHLSHVVDTSSETIDPVPRFPASDDDRTWVPLTETHGAEETALVVSYLKANDIEAFALQERAGREFGITIGGMDVSRIMVPEEQEQMARSLRGNLVNCGHCQESLEISDQEVLQGWFICPECQGTDYQSDTVTCLSCGSRLELEKVERERGWYRCPDCDQLTPMITLGKQVECGHCGEGLELSDQEVIQGWFICPVCQGMGHLGGLVTCLSCGNRQDLHVAEWQKGWYRCPKCNRVTNLSNVFDVVSDSAPDSLDVIPDDDWIEADADWVELKEVIRAEEATRLVSCLAANGIEATTRRGSAEGAFGLAMGTLDTFRVMVREGKRQLALALLEVEVEEGQHGEQEDGCVRSR